MFRLAGLFADAEVFQQSCNTSRKACLHKAWYHVMLCHMDKSKARETIMCIIVIIEPGLVHIVGFRGEIEREKIFHVTGSRASSSTRATHLVTNQNIEGRKKYLT
jgi:hypothetical protein